LACLGCEGVVSGSITHIRPMRSGIANAAKVMLALPYGALAILGLLGGAIIEVQVWLLTLGLLAIVALWVFVRQKSGKMIVAAISITLWIVALLFLQVGLTNWMPVWMSILAGASIMVLVAFLGTALMIEWRRQYYLSRVGGCQTVEWEWVYVGKEAAHTHPLGRLSFGIICVALFLIFGVVWQFGYYFGRFPIPYFLAGVAFEMLLLILTLLLVIFRHPAAYPSVFFLLCLNFPFSIPFLLYWADGVRPNLIYRHRYERLVFPEEHSGELYAK